MKKTLIALLAVAAVAAVPAFAATAGEAADDGGGKITVTGTGIVLSVPDTAQWSFGVTIEADSATRALAQANAAMQKIVAAVRGAGIAEDDVRTEHVSLSPHYERRGDFVASSSVHVIVRRLSLAGRVVDAAVDAGANTVGGPSFAESDRERLYRQALRAAYTQARLSAQALAEASGVALGRVLEVHEGGGAQPVPMLAEADRAVEAPTQIEPGKSSTYATVSVTFATS